MRRIALLSVGILVALAGVAAACPFCGGKGASGIAENLILVAGMFFGVRALMRAMQRRRSSGMSAQQETSGAGSRAPNESDVL